MSNKKNTKQSAKQSVPKNMKDGVFRLLFNDEARLLELYNALHGTDYGKEVDLKIQTLEETVFINIKNDIAFLLNNILIVLLEHQSTINPNMPLRFLLYIARIYDTIIETTRIYRESQVELPTPEFYVFYNGKADYPARQDLKLSHAFCEKDAPINLELVVHVININYEKGASILKKCKTLQDYSYFIYQERVLEQQGCGRDEAVRTAIKICKAQNILRDFLEDHEQEVFGMLFKELTEEEAREIYFQDGLEHGLQQGIHKIILDNLEQGTSKERICEKLCRYFSLSPEEARAYFEQYSKEEDE